MGESPSEQHLQTITLSSHQHGAGILSQRRAQNGGECFTL